MRPRMDETQRMTKDEADLRFDAIAAAHRDGKQSPRTRRETDATIGTLVVVIVFCLGVGCGLIWPARPFAALLVGIPSILVGFGLVRRWRQRRVDD